MIQKYHLPFLQTATSKIQQKIKSAFLCRFIVYCLPVSSREGNCLVNTGWFQLEKYHISCQQHKEKCREKGEIRR